MSTIASFLQRYGVKRKRSIKTRKVKPIITTNTLKKIDKPFTERFRPKSLDWIYGHPNVISNIKTMLETGEMPHLLIYGPAGVGKNSLISAIIGEIYQTNWKHSVLELNASDERSIYTIQTTVKNFSRQVHNQIQNQIKTQDQNKRWKTNFKIVILDQANSLMTDSQAALRRMMEDYSKTTRFCLICQSINGLIDPIVSRCAKIYMPPIDNQSMIALGKRIINQINSENHADIFMRDDDLLDLVKKSNKDCRKFLIQLENKIYFNQGNKNDQEIKDFNQEYNDQLVNEVIRILDHEELGIKSEQMFENLIELMDEGWELNIIIQIMFNHLIQNYGKYNKIYDCNNLMSYISKWSDYLVNGAKPILIVREMTFVIPLKAESF